MYKFGWFINEISFKFEHFPMNFGFCGPNMILNHVPTLQAPADLINRKRPFSICFPYNAVQYLWCKIDELIRSGHMVDACEKLRNLLHGALLNHLKLVYCTLMFDSRYIQLSCKYALHFFFTLFFFPFSFNILA